MVQIHYLLPLIISIIMKTIIIIFLILFSTLSYAKDISYGSFYTVEYVKTIDGDTITVNLNQLHPLIGKNINIRINGIDTPELRGKCFNEKFLALEAKMFVNEKLNTTNRLYLKNVKRGKYFRIVADVVIDEGYLSELLLDNMLAVPYNGGTKTANWCE